jgi:hypothetical protein
MVDVTKPPERQFRLEQVGRSKNGNGPNIGHSELASDNNPALPKGPGAWPFRAESYSPLAWWRLLPPDAFRDAERLLLITTLRGISVLHGGDDLAAAMRGDAAGAIGAALDLLPVDEVTLQVDITMTALMNTALGSNAASALVMAQVIGLSDVGHELTTELAASWLDYGERHSDDRLKFGDARVVLLTAFEERRNKGDDT